MFRTPSDYFGFRRISSDSAWECFGFFRTPSGYFGFRTRTTNSEQLFRMMTNTSVIDSAAKQKKWRSSKSLYFPCFRDCFVSAMFSALGLCIPRPGTAKSIISYDLCCGAEPFPPLVCRGQTRNCMRRVRFFAKTYLFVTGMRVSRRVGCCEAFHDNMCEILKLYN